MFPEPIINPRPATEDSARFVFAFLSAATAAGSISYDGSRPLVMLLTVVSDSGRFNLQVPRVWRPI